MGKKQASLAEKWVVVAADHFCTLLWDARVFLVSSHQHGHPCVAFYANAELWRIEMRLRFCITKVHKHHLDIVIPSSEKLGKKKKSSGNKACGWPRDEWQRLSLSLSWGEGFGLSAEGFLVWNEASELFRHMGFLLQRRALTITLRNCLSPWAPNIAATSKNSCLALGLKARVGRAGGGQWSGCWLCPVWGNSGFLSEPPPLLFIAHSFTADTCIDDPLVTAQHQGRRGDRQVVWGPWSSGRQESHEEVRRLQCVPCGGHTPGGGGLLLGENWAESSRGASAGTPRLRREHPRGYFQRTLHVPDLFVYMTSNPVNNLGLPTSTSREPSPWVVHLGWPSALLCPALLRGSFAVC